MGTVKDHFGVAELLDGVWTPGHYYYWRDDPVGHDGHLHCAFSPRGEPDAPGADPVTAVELTEKAGAFKAAIFEAFPAAVYLGGIVRKHRNEDPAEPWSQHTFGNAIDAGGDHALQDQMAAWLESEWTGGTMGSADDYFDGVKAAGVTAAEFGKDAETAHGYWRRARGQTRPDPATDPDGAAGWDWADTGHAPPGGVTISGTWTGGPAAKPGGGGGPA